MKALFLSLAVVFLVAAPALAEGEGGQDSGVSGMPLPRFAALKSDNVYMRTGPSMDYPIRWIYKKEGLPVEIVQEFDSWRRIRDQDGETGWVHKILLSGHRSAVIRHSDKSPDKSPESSSVEAFGDEDLVRPVARLEEGVVVALKSCTKRACFATFSPYEGWIEKKYLWGVYASEVFN